MNRGERNRCLNMIKGIGCIGVVFMHVQFSGEFGKLVFLLARFAVPVFFMISGYYAYGTDQKENRIKITRRLKKIIYIFISAMIPYIVYSIFNPADFSWTGTTILRVLFLGDFKFAYADTLCFLQAQIYGYLLLILLNKWNLYSKAYIFIPVLLGVCTYVRACTTDVCFFNNFLLSAIPYMLTGHYIAAHEGSIKKIVNNKMIITGIFVSILFLGVRRFLIVDISYLGVIIYAIGMFLFAVQNPSFVLYKTLERIGKKYSLHIYVLHLLLFHIFGGLISNNWVRPIAIFLITLFVSLTLRSVQTLLSSRGEPVGHLMCRKKRKIGKRQSVS